MTHAEQQQIAAAVEQGVTAALRNFCPTPPKPVGHHAPMIEISETELARLREDSELLSFLDTRRHHPHVPGTDGWTEWSTSPWPCDNIRDAIRMLRERLKPHVQP